jgi:D-2-hydroxyglutarate dehydrogenase
LHGSVLGVEAVLADGRVLDGLAGAPLRKDNSGYDLKQLFIGSEGTLGVVTGVAVAVAPLPTSTQVALLKCSTFEAVQLTLMAARKGLGEILSAFEFLDAEAMAVTLAHPSQPPLFDPVPSCDADGGRFSVLIETSGSCAEHDQAKLAAFFDKVTSEGEDGTPPLVVDGVLAESEAQAQSIWRVRETATLATAAMGNPVFKYDFSLPPERFYALAEEARARVRACPELADAAVVAYGHVGDGNLHLNVVLPGSERGAVDKRGNDVEALEAVLEPWIYEEVANAGGSVSAEHGMGLLKQPLLELANGHVAVELMRTLKESLDPNYILNPQKVLALPNKILEGDA